MENLKIVIDEVIKEINGNNDKKLNKIVYEIVKKIIDLPEGIDTTIANLIDYNPEKVMVDPLTQGQIIYIVETVCNKLDIKLEMNSDDIGGLA